MTMASGIQLVPLDSVALGEATWPSIVGSAQPLSLITVDGQTINLTVDQSTRIADQQILAQQEPQQQSVQALQPQVITIIQEDGSQHSINVLQSANGPLDNVVAIPVDLNTLANVQETSPTDQKNNGLGMVVQLSEEQLQLLLNAEQLTHEVIQAHQQSNFTEIIPERTLSEERNEAAEPTTVSCEPPQPRPIKSHCIVVTSKDLEANAKNASVDAKDQGPPFVCDVCGQSFAKYGKLCRHKKKHLDEKPFPCLASGCGESFNVQENLVLHDAIHRDGRPACPECGKTFSRLASLKAHLLLHQRDETLMCNECGEEFSTLLQLKRHAKEHEIDEDENVRLGMDPSTQSESERCMDQDDHHQSPAFAGVEEVLMQDTLINRVYQCSDCGETFERHKDLKGHLRIHRKMKNILYARKKKRKSKYLIARQREKSTRSVEEAPSAKTEPEHPDSVQADGDTFPKDSRTACKFCDKSFKKPSQLERHIRVHTGERPFKCVICNKTFNQKGALLIHQSAKHSMLKPHRCDLCSRSFSQKGNLRSHILRVHTIGDETLRYKCDTCSCTFKKLGSLNAHMSKVHAGDDESRSQNPKFSRKRDNVQVMRTSEKPQNKSSSVQAQVAPQQLVLGQEANLPSGFETQAQLNFSQTYSELADHEKDILTQALRNCGVLIGEEQPVVINPLPTESQNVTAISDHSASASAKHREQDRSIIASLHDPQPAPAACCISEPSSLTGSQLPNPSCEPSPSLEPTTAQTLGEEGAAEASDNTLSPRMKTLSIADPASGVFRTHVIRKDGKVCWHRCNYCTKEFKKPSDLVRHIRVHTRERPFKCPQCFRTFAVKSTLGAHLKTHAGSKEFRCHQCWKKFSSSGSLKVHLRLHSGLRPYACPYCDKVFRTSGHRKSHVASHFKTAREERRRRLKKETEIPDEALQQPIYISDKGFVQLRPKMTHMRSGLTDRPYRCNRCIAAFKKSSHLKQHIRSHTGEKPFQCMECNCSFVSTGVLKAHLRTHLGLKSFTCSICYTKFTTNGSLKRHMSTHSETRPYMCPYCRKTFKTNVNCRKHMRTHKKNLVVQCETDFEKNQEGNSEKDASVVLVQSSTLEVRETSTKAIGQTYLQSDTIEQVSSVNSLSVATPENLQTTTQHAQPGATITHIHERFDHSPSVHRDSSGHQHLTFISDPSQSERLSAETEFDSEQQLHPSLLNHQLFEPGPLQESSMVPPSDVFQQPLKPAVPHVPSDEEPRQNEPVQPRQDSRPRSTLTGEDILSSNNALSRYSNIEAPTRTIPNGQNLSLLSTHISNILPESHRLFSSEDTSREFHPEPENRRLTETASSLNSRLVPPEAQARSFPDREVALRPPEESAAAAEPEAAMTLVDKPEPEFIINRTMDSAAVEETSPVVEPVTKNVDDEELKCNVCEKSFQRVTQLRQHQKIHVKRRKFNCGDCGTAFATSASLREHIKFSHDDCNPFKCRHCEQVFTSKPLLLLHLRTHKNIQCPFCPVMFRTEALKRRHVRALHANEESKFEFIDASGQLVEADINEYLSRQRVKSEEKKPRPTEIVQITEEQAAELTATSKDENISISERFLIESALEKSRLTRKQTKEVDKDEPKHAHGCDFCTKTFKKPSDLVRHMRVHTGEKPFKCHVCSKAFTVKSSLDTHIRTHFPTAKTIRCHVCNSFFATNGSLKVHMRLHTGSKPFKCPHCDLAFRTSGHRKSHLDSHLKGTVVLRKSSPAEEAVDLATARLMLESESEADPRTGEKFQLFEQQDGTVVLSSIEAALEQPPVQESPPLSQSLDKEIAEDKRRLMTLDEAIVAAGASGIPIPINLDLSSASMTNGFTNVQLTGIDAATGSVISTQAVQIDATLLQQLLQAQPQPT